MSSARRSLVPTGQCASKRATSSSVQVWKRYEAPFLCAAYPDDEDAWFFEVARQQEQARLEAQAATIRQQLAAVMGGR